MLPLCAKFQISLEPNSVFLSRVRSLSSIPTFQLWKNGKLQEQYVAGNSIPAVPKKLTELIDKHLTCGFSLSEQVEITSLPAVGEGSSTKPATPSLAPARPHYTVQRPRQHAEACHKIQILRSQCPSTFTMENHEEITFENVCLARLAARAHLGTHHLACDVAIARFCLNDRFHESQSSVP